MIEITVNASLKVSDNEMRLDDIVNTDSFVYSRVKLFNMEYDEKDEEMKFHIEYKTNDDEFLKIVDIINTSNILGSELVYLNIDSKHIPDVDPMDLVSKRIGRLTIPKDADMELRSETDYFVFAKRFDEDIKFWAGKESAEFPVWVESAYHARRYKTLNNCLEQYCSTNKISLFNVGFCETNNGKFDNYNNAQYYVCHIVNDVLYSVDFYKKI